MSHMDFVQPELTSKWQRPVKSVVGVDPDSARTERVSDLNSSGEVGSVDRGGKTVGSVVTDLDDVGLGLELGDCADRAEDLFLLDLHVFGYVGEDCGFDEVTLVTLAVAAGFDGCAGLLALLDVARLELVIVFLKFASFSRTR
jgi:hypothetical protein